MINRIKKTCIAGLILLCGCSEDPVAVNKKLEVKHQDLIVNSAELVKLVGQGFDTSMRLYLNDQLVPIDTLRATEIIFGAPGAAGAYDVIIKTPKDTLEAGAITISENVREPVVVDTGTYKVDSASFVGIVVKGYENSFPVGLSWKRNSDGSYCQVGKSYDYLEFPLSTLFVTEDRSINSDFYESWYRPYVGKMLTAKGQVEFLVTHYESKREVIEHGKGVVTASRKSELRTNGMHLEKRNDQLIASVKGNLSFTATFSYHDDKGRDSGYALIPGSTGHFTLYFSKK